MKRTLILACIAATALCSCERKASVPAIDLANLDTLTVPGADFYQYATGGWQKNNPLKPEFSRYGSFDVLAENNQKRLNDLFQELASEKTVPGTEAQKIADLYTMGLDSVRLNNEGAAPILPRLQALECVTDLESFAKVSGQMAKSGVGSIYYAGVMEDLMNSTVNILYVGESGLALHNRDYYLLPQHEAIRAGYKAFLEKIFTLAGYDDAARIASDAYELEMALAVPFWSMNQQRDIAAQYNPMSSEQLYAAYPNLHLDLYFAELGIPTQEKLILEQPSYFKAINEIVAKTDPQVLKHYLQASVLSDACNCMSDDFYTANFEFFSKQMSGIQEQKPRWKRAMSAPNFALGEAVGKLYVEKYFPKEDKEKMLSIVKSLQASLGEHIDSLSWMGAETKAMAHEKLAAFTVKIGYPDKWKDYSALEIDPTLSYMENLERVSIWAVNDNLADLGQPVDKEKWHMSPQTVNAYYNPTSNEICFPAGILQPPFFFHDADDAVNYGAIGVVISHEMTHGFDDQGRLFDKDGNMTNWWKDEDDAAFRKKTAVLVKQFDEIEVLPGVHANGTASLGENIADQGGLRIAFTALQNTLAGKETGLIDGFTPEQRFYLAYATVWAQNITDEEKQKRVLTDVHSIGRDRVNATLRNIDTFFEAFGIKEGDPMWRPECERVIIW